VTSARRAVPALPVETLVVAWNGYLLPIVRLSDHAPFWDVGFPAVMITDTAFLRNPHYHQPSDTLDTLDLPFLTQAATATAAAAADLARPVSTQTLHHQDTKAPLAS
jgi:Zn-dependent M28 family amino/carboxypeptidase